MHDSLPSICDGIYFTVSPTMDSGPNLCLGKRSQFWFEREYMETDRRSYAREFKGMCELYPSEDDSLTIHSVFHSRTYHDSINTTEHRYRRLPPHQPRRHRHGKRPSIHRWHLRLTGGQRQCQSRQGTRIARHGTFGWRCHYEWGDWDAWGYSRGDGVHSWECCGWTYWILYGYVLYCCQGYAVIDLLVSF